MKVLQHSAVCLTIHERLLGVELLSLATVLTGIFMFFLFEPPVDWVGAGCIVIGILFAASAPTETFIFDKRIGRLTICRRRFSSQQVSHHPMANLRAIELEPLEVLGTPFYRITLKLNSGEVIEVTQTISTNWVEQQKIVRHIRGFLNLPAPAKVSLPENNAAWQPNHSS